MSIGICLPQAIYAEAPKSTMPPHINSDSPGKTKTKQDKNLTKPLSKQEAKAESPAALARSSTLLKVLVVHNENIPPLPANLCVGADFDEKTFVKKGPIDEENRWYQIPEWIAGSFRYGKMDVYLGHNYHTGVTKEDLGSEPPLKEGRNRGIFRDSKGRPWQKAYGGLMTDGSDNATHYRKDDELVGTIIDDDHYVESSTGIEFDVDPKTEKIKTAFREERIRKFTHAKDGRVLVDYSDKSFDETGAPYALMKKRGIMLNYAPYVEYEKGEHFESEDYDQLCVEFCKFLKAKGAADLIPDKFKNISTDTKPEKQ